MGALQQSKLPGQSKRKPAAAETRKLDRYGRDPESPSEKLRSSTDFERGTGYSPFFNAVLADLPRLSSGHTCDMFVLVVNHLSVGRTPRSAFTLPISSADLAELCRANVRDIQRQLSELEDRGMISVKTVKNGTVKYAVSLLYSKWRELDDYAVWKRRQVVAIDEAGDDTETDDAEALPISKDAVNLFSKPAAVRPGRATRAAKVSVGIREIVCQNDSAAVDLVFNPVVQSGRLVITTTCANSESKAKGEDKGNAERHPCRAIPPNKGKVKTPGKVASHPRSAEVVNIFDPLLMKSGSRLLSPDNGSLMAACAELGAMPHDALLYFVMRAGGRGSRPISAPSAVTSIIREARQNWEASQKQVPGATKAPECAKCGGDTSGGSIFSPGVGALCFGCAG